jgi:hypothetical protein
MSDPVWLATAKTLPAGRHTKIECCANDKSMRVCNEEKGFRAWCFRCGAKEYQAHGEFSIDQLKRRRAELAITYDRVVRLPQDFTTDIPPSEAVWLYRAGVGPSISRHYGFGYSQVLRRVILPIYKDGVLDGYTARSTINERPKYIEKVVSPSSTVFVADPSIALPWPDDGIMATVPDCVLCEDILSTVRVGRWVRTCVSLLGTADIPSIYSRIKIGSYVALWLDPDKAGKKGASVISRSLSLQGYKVKLIRSDKDPKYYSNKEIRRFLTE